MVSIPISYFIPICVLFFGLIVIGIAIFTLELADKKERIARNNPDRLRELAYLLSDDVTVFGGRRKGAEHKSYDEIVEESLNNLPGIKCRLPQ